MKTVYPFGLSLSKPRPQTTNALRQACPELSRRAQGEREIPC
jgi:hypothetical protein